MQDIATDVTCTGIAAGILNVLMCITIVLCELGQPFKEYVESIARFYLDLQDTNLIKQHRPTSQRCSN